MVDDGRRWTHGVIAALMALAGRARSCDLSGPRVRARRRGAETAHFARGEGTQVFSLRPGLARESNTSM
jgi:hypothetical protein